jgi:hypothetical protein
MANKFSKQAALNKKKAEDKKNAEAAMTQAGKSFVKLVGVLLCTIPLAAVYYYFFITSEIRYKIVNNSPLLVVFTLILTFAITLILYFLFRGVIKSKTGLLLIPSLVIAIGATIYFVVGSPYRSIETHMNEYTNIKGLSQGSDGAYITGKVIAVNRETNQIDDLFYKLPNNLRALTSDEVKTIIWVDCVNNVVGSYEDGEKAYRVTCKLSIIDPAKATYVDSGSFVGGDPGSVRYKDATGIGSTPNAEMANYISALPRR